MSDFAKEVLPANLEDEMRRSYLDYAMSVIIGRALPDVRDGLKPVHRRALYAMSELNNTWNSSYKKSARIVGDVIGKYHPHGDTAVYDTIVRMAQPFSLRYMLVDGQGNFGSIDGDNAAAMRYTEIRMAKITGQLLEDIDKETVDFISNYDGSESEPSVFPTRIPNLLINGSSGIAVGMATNIPPHNITEVIDTCIALIDDPSMDMDALIRMLPGPDFPTGAIINGTDGIKEAYRTGRGRVIMRSKTHIETDESNGRQSIIVDELPYQVNKARLIEKISELVKEKKIEGISTLRDESDKDGIRMYIEIRRGDVPEVVLNNLFQQTQLQSSFGINMVALTDGQPRLMNLQEILEAFVRHRREVVTRRTIFELRKARERAHILEGLAVALENIDPIIELIKKADTPAEAKAGLLAQPWAPGLVSDMLARAGADASRPDGLAEELGMHDNKYQLSAVQAQAILDMRLQKLTGLEQDKIVDEYKDIIVKIEDLLEILTVPDRLMSVIRNELIAVKEQFGDERRSVILENRLDLTMEDLITEEDMVVTLSHEGYIKTQPLSDYRAQRRGGRGKSATSMKEEDFIESLFIANTHDTLLCFSSSGQVYWLKVYELPSAGRQARGKPIVNLLPLESEERINAVLPIREYDDNFFIIFVTAKGVVKKTKLTDYSRRRASGLIAINLDEDDHLIRVLLTDGTQDILLISNAAKACRFSEDEVRVVGRTARGVRGMNLEDSQHLVSAIALRQQDDENDILTVSENGYGKRTLAGQFPRRSRGTKGVIAMQTSERNGNLIGASWVTEFDEVMLISDKGTLVRTRIKEISRVGRNTQGVNVINLVKNEHLIGMARIINDEDESEDENILENDAENTTVDLSSEDSTEANDSDESSDTESSADDSADE